MDFQQIQQQWGQWLRQTNPQMPLAGIAPERAQVYRQLIRNNFKQLINTSFPVCRQLPGLDWQNLLDQFIEQHQAQTPLFHQVSREFIEYLLQQPELPQPYLAELAHYEWLELDLSIADSNPITAININHAEPATWGQYQLKLHPLTRFQAYRYPVHRIGPDWQPASAPAIPTWLLLYRRANYQIGFIELSPAMGLLLSRSEPALDQALTGLAQESGLDATQLRQQALPAIAQLYQQNILYFTEVASHED